MKVQQFPRKFSWLLTLGALVLLAVAVFAANGAHPAQASGGSHNVAVVGSPNCISYNTHFPRGPGSGMPTTASGFGSFTFTNVPPATPVTFGVTAGTYDTVLLNVCSSEMNVINCGGDAIPPHGLSIAAETALVQFVRDGGKLIIYDGECSGDAVGNAACNDSPGPLDSNPTFSPVNDYSWLPAGYRMTTNFACPPGYPTAASYPLTIQEENILSTTPSNDPYYINAGAMSQYSEVQDANYMATHETQWCVDMTVTKRIPGQPTGKLEGWTHSYARLGSGLMLYNGFDRDAFLVNGGPNGDPPPQGPSGEEDSRVAPNGLLKIWLQELQAPLNPSASELPCTPRGDSPLPCAPAPAGMVAWWKLDELKGDPTIKDTTSNHHDSSMWPGRFNANMFGPGMVRGALDFFDTSGTMFVTVPSDPQLEPGGGDFTIDAWVYPVTTADPNAIQPIVDKWDPPPSVGPSQGGYAFYIQNGHLMFKYSDGILTSTVDSSPTLVPYDHWSHVAVTVAKFKFFPGVGIETFSRLYIDGQPHGLQGVWNTGLIANSKDLVIGGTRLTSPPGLAGIALDEVEIFDTAVPQEEIQAIFNALNSGKCPIVPSVGGVAALSVSSSGSPVPWTPLAAVAAGVMAVMGAGLWYGRRRWLR